jgi:hypothetical protein
VQVPPVTVASRPKIPKNNTKPSVKRNDWPEKLIFDASGQKSAENQREKTFFCKKF